MGERLAKRKSDYMYIAKIPQGKNCNDPKCPQWKQSGMGENGYVTPVNKHFRPGRIYVLVIEHKTSLKRCPATGSRKHLDTGFKCTSIKRHQQEVLADVPFYIFIHIYTMYCILTF